MLPMPPDAHVPARCPRHNDLMQEDWLGRPECPTCEDEQTLYEDIRKGLDCRCGHCTDCAEFWRQRHLTPEQRDRYARGYGGAA